MIKNKDGSYNKFSLLIISLIIIIGVGIVGSLVVTESPTIDVMSLAYIGLIISGGLTIYYGKKVFFKPKPIVTSMPQTSTSTPSKMEVVEVHSQEQFTVEDEPIKIERVILGPHEETTKSSFGIVSMGITLIVTAVPMIVGATIVNSMITAIPELPAGSSLTTTQTEILNTTSTAFSILPIILIVGLIIIIMSATFGLIRN